MNTICIMCPMGCDISIKKVGGEISVSGATCKRGEVYGKAEFENPIRMVTTLVPHNGKVISVKTSVPILKTKIDKVLAEIKKINVTGEVSCGDILIKNILETGADIVVTSNI